jgi:cytochrome P450
VDALLAEVQRFDPPVQNTRRFVAQTCEIDGVRLEAGEVILVLLASANRDPLPNAEPTGFCWIVLTGAVSALAAAGISVRGRRWR